MRLRNLLLGFSFILAFVAPFGAAQAQRGSGSWEFLGERTVGFGVDNDSIAINQNEEWYRNKAFRKLRFSAERNDVNLISIKIVYLNDHVEELPIGRVIPKNGTLVVDLPGDRSFLKRIDMRYRSNVGISIGSGGIRISEAVVKVSGERAAGGRPQPQPPGDIYLGRGWVPLGEKEVGFRVDRDVIVVGQSEDWFRTRSFRRLHLVAQRSEIRMIGLRIVYMNGFAEDIALRQTIPVGGDLAVDLKGDRSYIKQIEMTYRSRPSFRGQALIKVYGELARR